MVTEKSARQLNQNNNNNNNKQTNLHQRWCFDCKDTGLVKQNLQIHTMFQWLSVITYPGSQRLSCPWQ